MEKILQIKNLIRELEKLEKITCELEKGFENDPENIELEKAFDSAYDKEFKVYMNTAYELVNLLNIDAKIAREMLRTRRDDIKKIIEKMEDKNT